MTPDILLRIAPYCPDPPTWAAALSDVMARYHISDSLNDTAAFLAQCAFESNQFRQLEEHLSYSAERLCAVWPSKFPDLPTAEAYAGQPQRLANYVYAGMYGNQGQSSGDGWLFRGRGCLQITFRANYSALAAHLGTGLDPDSLLTPIGASTASAWFWQLRHLDPLGASGALPDFDSIGRRINGSDAGQADRRLYWHRARQALGLE